MSAELIEQLVLVAHLLLSLAIIGLIMLQQGKGADMGASFGAGASQTLFGSTGGGNVLTRATAWMVALFFATSFGLAVIAKNKTSSVNDADFVVPETSAPVLDEAVQAVDDVPADLPSDIPSVDDDLPAMSAEEPVEDDLPDLQ
ncbi:MAG: preprotein translocase subunit SecG [Pseudomonadota bacterium]